MAKCDKKMNAPEINTDRKSQELEQGTKADTVEGYAYCATNKQRCLNDCGGNGNATPFLSDLN